MASALQTKVSEKRRAKFVIGGAVVVLSVVALVLWAMQQPSSADAYATTSELVELGRTPAGEHYRVNGRVVAGSIVKRGLDTTFTITDGRTELVVVTDQPLPSAFRKGSDVVARGRYDGRRLIASEVLAKCPSKFKPKA